MQRVQCVTSQYLHSILFTSNGVLNFKAHLSCDFWCLHWEPGLTGDRRTDRLPLLVLTTTLGSFTGDVGPGGAALWSSPQWRHHTALGPALLSLLGSIAKHWAYVPWPLGWIHVSFHSPKLDKCFICSPNYFCMYIKE